jgi:uncharacterized protein (UPF0332 family)
MNPEHRAAYIGYRFKRAVESLEEANILCDNGKWNATINRLYYACFYSAIALLLKHDIEVKTHDGARLKFGLHFVKTGVIDIRYGKLYSQLFDYRQKGDYGDMYDFDEITATTLQLPVQEFLNEINKHLQE